MSPLRAFPSDRKLELRLLVGSARRPGSTNFKPKSIRSTTKTMRKVLTPPAASTLCATLALASSAS